MSSYLEACPIEASYTEYDRGVATKSDDLNAVGCNQNINLLKRLFEALFEFFQKLLGRPIVGRHDFDLYDLVNVLDSSVFLP